MSSTQPPPPPGQSPTNNTTRDATVQQSNQSRQESVEINSQIEQIVLNSVAKEQELNEILERRLSILGKTAAARNEIYEQDKNTLTQMVMMNRKGKEGTLLQEQFIQEHINSMKTLSDARKEALKDELNSTNEVQEQLDILQKQAARMQDIENTQKDINKLANKAASAFGLVADTSDTILGKTVAMADQLRVMYSEQGWKGVGSSIMAAANEAFGLEKIMASLVESAVELAFELDKASKAFGSKTGFDIAGVNEQLLQSSKLGVSSGVSITQAGAAFSDIASNMSNFKMSATNANNSLIETVTLLDKFGVSAGNSTKSLDIMTTAMNMSNKQAERLTMSIATMGRSINVSGSEMIQQFNDNAKDLLEFGPQMEGVFKNLAVQAKLTGISMQSLISVAKKFDTFESAANQVGQLNAILGTNLSSMDMMNMTHDQRIQRIKEEVKASVGNFDTLDRYSKMYIQNAMGVGSVEEASRLLNMSQSDYLDNQSKMQASAETQKQLAELTKEYVPLLEKMKLNFMEIVRTLDPLIKGFAALLGFFAKYPAALYTLVGALAALTLGINLYGAATKVAGAQSSLFYMGLKLLMLGIMFASGKSFWVGIGIIAAGVILMGLAFMFANKEASETTTIFQILMKLLGKKINPPFINAFAHMALGVVMLALALKLVKGQTLLAAIAMALLAGAFALAFYGFAAVITAIKEMIQVFIGSVDILPKVAKGMYLIAGAMLAMGIAAMVSASSMIVFATGFGAIAAIVMISAGIGALSSMGDSMDSIGSGMERFADGLSKVVKISKDMSSLSSKAFMAFNTKGSETSAIITSNDLVKTAVSGKIKVDVNIPEIKSPTVNLSVYLNGVKLDTDSANSIAKVIVGAS